MHIVKVSVSAAWSCACVRVRACACVRMRACVRVCACVRLSIYSHRSVATTSRANIFRLHSLDGHSQVVKLWGVWRHETIPNETEHNWWWFPGISMTNTGTVSKTTLGKTSEKRGGAHQYGLFQIYLDTSWTELNSMKTRRGSQGRTIARLHESVVSAVTWAAERNGQWIKQHADLY